MQDYPTGEVSLTGEHRPLSLYVHIPYCRTKCLYCDFNSYPTQATPWEEYLEALTLELSAYRDHPAAGRPLDTLFFGGGTPSLFPPAFFEALLPRIQALFPLLPGAEVTMEANPGTVSLESLTGYQQLGINRLSFGVQSFNEAHLKTLTRIHGPEEAIRAVELANQAGFKRISIDLMFGVPDQTVEGWEQELALALRLPVTHLSVYNLTPEEGTALVKLLARGRLFMPDEAYLVEMYKVTRARLRAAGFEPYEISNFTREQPCRHNLHYWTGSSYIGLGAGAHSYSAEGEAPVGWVSEGGAGLEQGVRWSVARGLKDYLQGVQGGRVPVESMERLTLEQAATEFFLTRGRLMRGIPLDELEARLGARARERVERRAASYLANGLLWEWNGSLALTDEGVLTADDIIAELSLAADRGMEAEARPRWSV